MKRYLRLVGIFAGASLSAQMEYRANFIAGLLESLGQVGIGLLTLVIFFRNASTLGGWTAPQAAVVLGLFMLTNSFIAVALAPNLNRIAESVRLGTMDFTLLKPIDAQFQVSTRNLNAFRIGDALIGVGIVVWGLVQLQGVTVGGVLLGLALYLSALVTVYSIWFMLATTAFWWVKVQNITELFNGFFAAARYPVVAFPGGIRFLLTFVVPIAFITTVPAWAVLGELPPGFAIASPLLAVTLMVVSRLFWRYALRNYTSASS
ncbi:ABC transporter permease [Deinococcus yavapaiensis]|uniref:ABC-2 type transport system permease protein n=1 Tax=Deinococcus yavapaiensis KR-236 TaxID=694435 RepID=A0A318SCB7_9DEIO|nr:ABC-2 family transporter protein [Deinococcus yavapaiensis]PYE54944.1 ABC-2 type transport system permease protein [Deinococcus yavapaiensis KR-236]